jgi:hypothetical protein
MTPANLQSHVIHPHIQEERRGEERRGEDREIGRGSLPLVLISFAILTLLLIVRMPRAQQPPSFATGSTASPQTWVLRLSDPGYEAKREIAVLRSIANKASRTRAIQDLRQRILKHVQMQRPKK